MTYPPIFRAHCFRPPCRSEQTYKLFLRSAPVYQCQGCEATREVQELWRPGVQRTSPGPTPPEASNQRRAWRRAHRDKRPCGHANFMRACATCAAAKS